MRSRQFLENFSTLLCEEFKCDEIGSAGVEGGEDLFEHGMRWIDLSKQRGAGAELEVVRGERVAPVRQHSGAQGHPAQPSRGRRVADVPARQARLVAETPALSW